MNLVAPLGAHGYLDLLADLPEDGADEEARHWATSAIRAVTRMQ